MEEAEMKFYVIYEFDVPHDLSVKSCNPPFRSRNFKLTECHDSEIFCPEYAGDRVKTGKHRKYAGILTRKQFDALVDDQELSMENVETLGSLTELGWLPAVSFTSYNGDCYQNAYVTPLPDTKRELTERDWNRIRAAMLSVYS
jgi:hypothetical protein